MIKLAKKRNMMKDLSNIAKYLERAGFIDQAKEIKNVMAALDGQFLIDPYTIPDDQRNVENQGYMGGDGTGGGYSLLHTPMVGQMADDEDSKNRQIAHAVKLIRRDYKDGKFDNIPTGKLLHLLAKRLHMNVNNSQEGGFIAGLAAAMGLIHPQEAFGDPEAFQAARIIFDDPDSVEMDNVDMIAGANGLMGNTVTDNGGAGQFNVLNDSFFYRTYDNLEGAYGPK